MATNPARAGQVFRSADGHRSPVSDTDRDAGFTQAILAWGAAHGRVYPWRNSADAYHVLIAEMMLRRTRADQVVHVYSRFVERFPDAATLAAASEDEVAELVRPLGLAWRVPAFRQMARRLVEEHGGKVPCDRRSLISLSGVGEYVAEAILCVAFNATVALVDTNTVRVAGRYFGFPVHAESRRRVPVRRAVARLIDAAAPRDSNLALLDFAAKVCRAGRPLCEQCPVTAGCSWRQAELARLVEVDASYEGIDDQADQRYGSISA